MRRDHTVIYPRGRTRFNSSHTARPRYSTLVEG